MIGTTEERLQEIDQMYPEWEPDTLWSRFEKNAVRFQDSVFMICDDCAYTYGQALEEVNRLARSCYACGMREGDHTAILLYNSPEYIFLTFALSKIGVVKVPVNMKLSEGEIAYVIQQSDCQFVISDTKEKIPQNSFHYLKKVIIRHTHLNDTKHPSCISWSHFLYLGEGINDAEILAMFDPYRLSDILYTSGSTSFPKGVMLTQDMLLRSSFGTCRTRRMEVGRRILVPIPLYHIFGYNEGFLAAMWVGGCVILSSAKATGEHVLEQLQKHRINDMIGVPIIIIHLLEAIGEKQIELPHLHAGYWASTCPDWVWDKAKTVLGISDVTTGYGMTECGSTTTMFPVGCTTEDLMHYQGYVKDCGCAGSSSFGGKLLELEIRDVESGMLLSAGERGELWCRGLTVTAGYYKNPEANASHFDEKGWFATGDVGVLDAQGRFTFQGRKDSMYKVNGENVSPQQLNYVIGSCKEVKAVETVGIRSPRYGEAGVAFIDPAEDTEEIRKKIASYMSDHLAGFQIPRYVVVGDSALWPRISCGKVGIGELKKLASAYVEQYEKQHAEEERKGIIWIGIRCQNQSIS